jgi:hypothetical protein
MKKIRNFYVFVLSLFLAEGLCQAQLNPTDLSAVEATTPLSADQMPLVGTFYSAAHPQIAPLPGNLFGLSGWDLGNGIYLMDDLDGSSVGGFHAMDDSALYSGGVGDEFTNSVTPYVFPTNGLWLWITNMADETVYANLNGATNYVYEIFSTTNVTTAPVVSNWNIETEVFPGLNTNTMPFTVPTAGRNPLFLWARDWTGITSNGNETPDWWFYEYFGTINLLDSDLDSQGNTLLSDYQYGHDPNVINFSLQFTNNYWNSTASGNASIQSGEPFYQAIVIDDTNYLADAVWQTYTGSNLTVNLGATAGWHSVWIGLRGRATNEIQTWKWKHLKLVSNAPALITTNPAVSTVSVPVIQIYGYSPESLASISCTVSNATSAATSVNTEITGQYYDTNQWDFTTNYFECLDIPLTNGLNVVTVDAVDLAGNTTVTNFNVTLDYSQATNPAIQLTWPQNGMQLCQGIFTVRGWTDDSSAQVLAQIVDTNGDTNVVNGEVERSGVFWLENLPLAEGTNALTLWITNSAGLLSMTNFSVVKNDMTLVLTNIADDLWLPTVHVSGLISDSSAPIWVNGVRGTNNGDGTWNAANVPVSTSGVASFDMSTDSSGGDPDANTNEDKPTEILTTMSDSKWTSSPQGPDDSGAFTWYLDDYFYSYGGSITGDYDYHWMDLFGNSGYDNTKYSWPECPGNCGEGTFVEAFDDDGIVGTNGGDSDWDGGGLDHCDIDSVDEGDEYRQTGQSEYYLQVGGKSTDKCIAEVSMSITAFQPDFLNIDPEMNVPSTNIVAGDFGKLDSSGNAYKQVSGGGMVRVTPTIGGVDYFKINGITPAVYTPTHLTECTAPGNPDNTRLTIGIGEVVTFTGMPDGATWIDSNGFTTTTNSGSATTLTASESPVGATVTATIDNVNTQWAFNVIAPSGVEVTGWTDLGFAGYTEGGIPGSDWIGAQSEFYLQVLPDSVSFSNMTARECVPPYSFNWPDGETTLSNGQTNQLPVPGCDNQLTDTVGPKAPLPIYRLEPTNGTGYVGKSFPQTWKWQYQNQDQQWMDCATISLTETYNPDAQAQETYQGQPGSWQGPWVQQ